MPKLCLIVGCLVSQHLLDLREGIIILVRAEVPVGEVERQEAGAQQVHGHKDFVCSLIAVEGHTAFTLEIGESVVKERLTPW
jgi:hypothetical protein